MDNTLDVLTPLAEAALTRLDENLESAGLCLSKGVRHWVASLRPNRPRSEYFLQGNAFPTLRFPLFVEQAVCGHHSDALQEQLIFSSINGYYHIRLVDNLMDGDTTSELGLLPALGLFHANFQSSYQSLFPNDHPFWHHFRRYWFTTADVTMRDWEMEDYDLQQFFDIAARKTCATIIPIAAVLHYLDLAELIVPWARCVESFGRWHQLHNDLSGWLGDHQRGATTYFLAEAMRRRRSDEPLESWVVREGYAWAAEILSDLMDETLQAAERLGSTGLLAYLEMRKNRFAEEKRDAEAGFAKARALFAAFAARRTNEAEES